MSVHVGVCVERIIQSCGSVERCTWTTATKFLFIYRCMKWQELKTPTSDQTNWTFFFLERNNQGFYSYHNYHWRSLNECLLPTTKHCASTPERRASCGVCKTDSSNPQSLWLGAQPLNLAAPSATPAPFSRGRNSTGHLQRDVLSLCSSHSLATEVIAGAVRRSDELDQRNWTGLSSRRTLHWLPCLSLWSPAQVKQVRDCLLDFSLCVLKMTKWIQRIPISMTTRRLLLTHLWTWNLE